MAHNNQISAQDAGRALQTVTGSESRRLPRTAMSQSELDKRRETIGRDDFLQLRLPLASLLNEGEIEELLDTARENNPRYEGEHQAREVALGRGFTVHSPQRLHPALKRQVRTRRKVSPWQAAVPTVPEEGEGEDEEDAREEGEIDTNTKRSKFSWKFSFKFFGGKDGRGGDNKQEAEPQSTSAPASLNRFA